MNYRMPGNKLRQILLERRPYVCEECGLSEWNNRTLPLEVHHLDGNRTNNEDNNLLLLCPNCHSLTSSFSKHIKKEISDSELIESLNISKTIHEALSRVGLSTGGAMYGRARLLIEKHQIAHLMTVPKGKKLCIDCGSVISNRSTRCKSCASTHRQPQAKHNLLTRDELKQLIRSISFVEIGKRYNVSDNAVRKWCEKYDLPKTKQLIKTYTDAEWDKI